MIQAISTEKIDFNEIIEDTYQTEGLEEIDTSIDANSYVEETYKEKIIEDITKQVELKNYNVSYINIVIETEDEDRYGEILEINLKISKVKDSDQISNEIEEVNIVIGRNEKIENESIPEEEKEELKKYLEGIYYTENINIEG